MDRITQVLRRHYTVYRQEVEHMTTYYNVTYPGGVKEVVGQLLTNPTKVNPPNKYYNNTYNYICKNEPIYKNKENLYLGPRLNDPGHHSDTNW